MIKTRVLATLASLFVITTLACRKEEAPKPAAEANKPARANLGATAWQVPVDIPGPMPAPQSAYIDFGWQTFVALNWPAMSPLNGGQNGQPDPNSTIGTTYAGGMSTPTVWSTFRDLDTVMLDNGTDPGASYTQAVAVPSNCPPDDGYPAGWGWPPLLINAHTFPEATLPKDYINQASGSPLVDQNGWYTFTNIRINQSEYNFIRQNQYYLGANQVAAYNGPNQRLEPFPQTGTESGYPALPPYAQYGALEVKAAWRVLDPSADPTRYYSQWGYFIQHDGTCVGPATFGLIALHILRLTPSTAGAGTPSTKTWFWASFEQIDNTASSAGIAATLAASGTPNGNCGTGQYNVPPPPVNGNIPWNNSNEPDDVCRWTNIPQNVQEANAAWQEKLSGTFWQYYQMVNTLNPCPADDTTCTMFPPINDPNNTINVTPFANTAIETYAQTNTCTDCHGFAAGNGAPTQLTGADQIFTFVLLNAYMPQTSSTTAKRDALRATFRNPPRSKPVAVKQ